MRLGITKDIHFENHGTQMLSATIAPNSATVSTMDNSVIGALKEGKTVGFNYDAAGRLVEDGLRGESFIYDRFGHPSVAQYTDWRADDYIAKYAYDASGTLHRRSMAYKLEFIHKDDPFEPVYPDSLRPWRPNPGDSGIVVPPFQPFQTASRSAASGGPSSRESGIGIVWPPGDNRRDSVVSMALTPHLQHTYCGNYEYSNGHLLRITTPVGYYEDGHHYFHLNDYQGNVRCVVSDTLRLVKAVHYYPGGSLFGEDYGKSNDTPLFQGSRLESYGRHSFYDLLNRHYDPVLCRFTSVDAKYDKYYPFTPYHYGLCNPVRFRDPDGTDALTTIRGYDITISACVYIYNSAYVQDKSAVRELSHLASEYKNALMNSWGLQTQYEYKGAMYSINWDIDVKLKKIDQEIKRDGISNFMRVMPKTIDPTLHPSEVVSCWSGRISSKRIYDIIHEMGHMLGLRDRYDSEMKKTDATWEDNVMGGSGKGKIESRNLSGIFDAILEKYHGSDQQQKAIQYPSFSKLGIWDYEYNIDWNHREEEISR